MTSPPLERTVLSSSPISVRNGSPTHRRSISPEDIGDITARTKHSPTRARSFDPTDPQVRERQLTMDVDMAMHLSRARRETLHSSGPVSPYETTHAHPHLSQPSPEHPFPGLSLLSPHAEHDTEEGASDIMAEEMADDEILSPHRQPSVTSLHQAHDPALLVSLEQSSPPNGTEDLSAPNYGLPTYQPNPSRTNFDFSTMEEFASAEKKKLGLTSPMMTRFSPSAIRGKAPTTDLSSIPGQENQAEGPSDSSSQRALRHRKLSTSNPNPRQRKGIGGKMALFESTSGEPPSSLSARLGLVLSGQSDDNITGMPNTSGLPPTGILNTGHDRPYRFSFYSNALSATIHARSLSELPADGQTFEELFSGINPPSGVPFDRPSDRQRSFIFSPSEPASRASPGPVLGGFQRPPDFAEATSSNNNTNHNRRSFGADAKMGQPADNNDTDSNTWWLDVQNPTDEEMKMLSKASFHLRYFYASLFTSFVGFG